MEENKKDERGKHLGDLGKKLAYGTPIQYYQPPHSNTWEEARQVCKEIPLPLSWNGKKMDGICGGDEFLKIGVMAYKKFIPIAKNLKLDKVEFVKTTSKELFENVVSEYIKNSYLVDEIEGVRKEIITRPVYDVTRHLQGIAVKRKNSKKS